jgi:hypothetical protein
VEEVPHNTRGIDWAMILQVLASDPNGVSGSFPSRAPPPPVLLGATGLHLFSCQRVEHGGGGGWIGYKLVLTGETHVGRAAVPAAATTTINKCQLPLSFSRWHTAAPTECILRHHIIIDADGGGGIKNNNDNNNTNTAAAIAATN